MRALVEGGHMDPARYAQIGLRGTSTNPAVLGCEAEIGIAHFTAQDVPR